MPRNAAAGGRGGLAGGAGIRRIAFNLLLAVMIYVAVTGGR